MAPASVPLAPAAEPILVEPTAPEPPADPEAGLIARAREPGIMSVGEPTEPAAAPAETTEAKPAADAPAEPTAPSAEAPAATEPLSYAEHKLTLPDGVAFEDARLGEYDAILGTHRIPPEARQQLADLYAGDVKTMLDGVRRDQWETWNKTLDTWAEDCAAHPQWGGSRFETSKAAAVRMIEFVLPPAERREWNEAALATGWGRHPVMFNFLNRLAQRFAEPALPPPNMQPAPPQASETPRSLRQMYRQNRMNRNG